MLLPLKADKRVDAGVAVAALQEPLPLKSKSWVDQLLWGKPRPAMNSGTGLPVTLQMSHTGM